MTVAETVKLYTADGAYLSFEDNIKGTPEGGKLADFVVLDHDIFEIEKERIKDIIDVVKESVTVIDIVKTGENKRCENGC